MTVYVCYFVFASIALFGVCFLETKPLKVFFLYIIVKLARKITLIKKEQNSFSLVQLVSLFEVYIKKPHAMSTPRTVFEYILTSLPMIVKIQKSFGKLLKWLRKSLIDLYKGVDCECCCCMCVRFCNCGLTFGFAVWLLFVVFSSAPPLAALDACHPHSSFSCSFSTPLFCPTARYMRGMWRECGAELQDTRER